MDSSSQRVIVFSHGFGVERDARGLFTDVASVFPKAKSVLFDYNIPDRAENTLFVRPLSEQKDILLTEIATVKEKFPSARIDIVAHSLGSIVVALAQPIGIRKVTLLAPPFGLRSSSLERFAGRPGSVIDPDGLSRLARRDGSFTLVPAAFWKERESINPLPLFNSLAEQTELLIIRAKQDAVVSYADASLLSPKIQIIDIDGDHDFCFEYRKELLTTLKNLLQ
ncbi:MAG: hypothetical protein ACEQSB_05135 [Undibacterium sp.]